MLYELTKEEVLKLLSYCFSVYFFLDVKLEWQDLRKYYIVKWGAEQ
jgi:hypothetical protein